MVLQGDDVEADLPRGEAGVLDQPAPRRSDDAGALRRSDRLGRRSVLPAASPAHLDEDEDVPVLRDEVELAVPVADVLRDDAEAALRKERRRSVLAGTPRLDLAEVARPCGPRSRRAAPSTEAQRLQLPPPVVTLRIHAKEDNLPPMAEALLVLCPDCGATLKVDAVTGAVLSHEAAESKNKLGSLEEAARENLRRKARAEDLFAATVEREKHKSEILEKTFRQALEKAKAEPGTRPKGIFDDE